MSTHLLFIHALSPLHAGTGQSLGAIDLAIARDRATNYPYLPGSSIKGVLRDRTRMVRPDDVVAVFGPETNRASDHAGALVVGDANLLLLPVRSVAGTFAYATCPFLLQRWFRDMREAGGHPNVVVPEPPNESKGWVTKESRILVRGTHGQQTKRRVVLEDLDVEAEEHDQAMVIAQLLGNMVFGSDASFAAWRSGLQRRLVILHDDVMTFLSEHATDVVARVRLENETKTVAAGALWYEENLPAESILVSVISTMPVGKTSSEKVLEVLQSLITEPLQLGANATIGRGRCRMVLRRGAS